MIEKLIQNYLQWNKLFYIYQSGVSANGSTDTYLARLPNMILNGAENGKHKGIILIDLEKAFDSLSHKILLDKMKCIGFTDETIKCFYSYLTSRALYYFFGHCVFGSRDHKLGSSSRICIRTFIAFATYKWYPTSPIR